MELQKTVSQLERKFYIVAMIRANKICQIHSFERNSKCASDEEKKTEEEILVEFIVVIDGTSPSVIMNIVLSFGLKRIYEKRIIIYTSLLYIYL